MNCILTSGVLKGSNESMVLITAAAKKWLDKMLNWNTQTWMNQSLKLKYEQLKMTEYAPWNMQLD